MTEQPFAQFGLTRNPFGSLSSEEWMTIAVVPALIVTALRGEAHLLLLGRKGRGKSTILHGLLRLLPDDQHAAYERIAQGTNTFEQDLAGVTCFALDETQRLAPWEWWRLRRAVRSGTRLLLGSHWNHAPLLRWAGLDVQVFRLSDFATRTHVAALLARRLEAFALDGDPLVWFDDDAIDWLWQRFSDNLRAQESFLYEVFQALETPGPITALSLAQQATAPP